MSTCAVCGGPEVEISVKRGDWPEPQWFCDWECFLLFADLLKAAEGVES